MVQTSYGTITITDTTDLEWFYGTGVLNGTGDSVNHQIVLTSNLINGAAVGSMYLDTQTSLVYKCIEVSDNSQTWQYVGNMASGAFEAIQEELENNYVQQDDALISTVSCYYRSTTHSTPSISSSETINGNESNTEDNNSNIWVYFLPKPKKNCYFYTCEEYTWGNGDKTYSSVKEMSNQSAIAQWCSSADFTYIDGGSLYANSVTASQIAAGTITANEINVSDLFSQNITASGTITGGTFQVATIKSGYDGDNQKNYGNFLLKYYNTNETGTHIYDLLKVDTTYASPILDFGENANSNDRSGATLRIGYTSLSQLLIDSNGFLSVNGDFSSNKTYDYLNANPDIYIECAGRLVNSGKTLAFQMPYGIGTSSISTLGASTGINIYYPNGSSGEKTLTAWGGSPSVTITATDFGIRVVIVRSSVWVTSYTGPVTVTLHNPVLT